MANVNSHYMQCGCVATREISGEQPKVSEACATHFEYGERMIEAALAGAGFAATHAKAPEPAPLPPAQDMVPLDVYPIELHPRTLHALVTAQLAAIGRMPNEPDALASYLSRIAVNASTIIAASRAEMRERG